MKNGNQYKIIAGHAGIYGAGEHGNCYELEKSLREMERVGKENKYICVESYRNEEEKTNLLYWQVTCESFCSPEEWKWWFFHTKYTGDYSFIYFE